MCYILQNSNYKMVCSEGFGKETNFRRENHLAHTAPAWLYASVLLLLDTTQIHDTVKFGSEKSYTEIVLILKLILSFHKHKTAREFT